MLKIGICIPTYNEYNNIKPLLTKIKQQLSSLEEVDCTVQIVDDSSPDGTAHRVSEISKDLLSKNFRVRLLVRDVKDGFGKAYIAGFTKILERPIDYVIQMDADLSHDPKYLASFIKKARSGADFVVASRYIKGGDTPDWPIYRKLLSRYGNSYARLFLGNTVTDYTGGYNMYSSSVLQKIDIKTLQAGGYGFLIELKYRALNCSKNIEQIPIIFRDRQHGASKIPKSTLFKNLILVPKIRFGK